MTQQNGEETEKEVEYKHRKGYQFYRIPREYAGDTIE